LRALLLECKDKRASVVGLKTCSLPGHRADYGETEGAF
jgi:hypothetical protein